MEKAGIAVQYGVLGPDAFTLSTKAVPYAVVSRGNKVHFYPRPPMSGTHKQALIYDMEFDTLEYKQDPAQVDYKLYEVQDYKYGNPKIMDSPGSSAWRLDVDANTFTRLRSYNGNRPRAVYGTNFIFTLKMAYGGAGLSVLKYDPDTNVETTLSDITFPSGLSLRADPGVCHLGNNQFIMIGNDVRDYFKVHIMKYDANTHTISLLRSNQPMEYLYSNWVGENVPCFVPSHPGILADRDIFFYPQVGSKYGWFRYNMDTHQIMCVTASVSSYVVPVETEDFILLPEHYGNYGIHKVQLFNQKSR